MLRPEQFDQGTSDPVPPLVSPRSVPPSPSGFPHLELFLELLSSVFWIEFTLAAL